MGQPAARIGDMTAHGGVITLGCLTVLIGGQPAARVSDMHTCPMVDGPKPHVGGPILPPGAMNVLIGGLPAARVGDMATCVGPPDTIIPPCCPTVLIGTSIGGSAGTAGPPGVATGAQISARVGRIDNNESITKEEHWVEIEFNDAAGLPVSGVPYTFTDPDGNESEGVLRLDGTIRRDALSAGSCQAVLYNVSQAKWSQDEARVGDTVKLTAKIEGFESGTEARFHIFKRDIKGPDVVVEEVITETQGDTVEAEWEYVYPEESEEGAQVGGEQEGYSAPEYFFEVIVGRCVAHSGLLKYKDYLEIELKDADGRSVPDEEYILYLSNGEVRRGVLDAAGYKKEEQVPPCAWDIAFPNITGAYEPDVV